MPRYKVLEKSFINNTVYEEGAIVEYDGNGSTWFQATEEFEQHALQITRELKRRCAAYPKPLYIYSVCVHPGTTRFFKTLGFLPDAWLEMTRTGHPLYRFRRA